MIPGLCSSSELKQIMMQSMSEMVNRVTIILLNACHDHLKTRNLQGTFTDLRIAQASHLNHQRRSQRSLLRAIRDHSITLSERPTENQVNAIPLDLYYVTIPASSQPSQLLIFNATTFFANFFRSFVRPFFCSVNTNSS